jgi:hypothetical protein
MKEVNYKDRVEGNKIQLMYQLDPQSKKTLESLSRDKIKQSISIDVKIFQNHKISIKS